MMINDLRMYNGDIVIAAGDYYVVNTEESIINVLANILSTPRGSFVEPTYGSSLMQLLASIDVFLGERAEIAEVFKREIKAAIAYNDVALLTLFDIEVKIMDNGDMEIYVYFKEKYKNDLQFVCTLKRRETGYEIVKRGQELRWT
jgi:phage baseplate assembly protein W